MIDLWEIERQAVNAGVDKDIRTLAQIIDRLIAEDRQMREALENIAGYMGNDWYVIAARRALGQDA